ncbi:myb-like protein V [Clytia hemisphaerica]|uniref:myb-like protein V n=1 Tax=Clytia hemisphaerica TaxID=252671 RepID=UPI0034D5BEBB
MSWDSESLSSSCESLLEESQDDIRNIKLSEYADINKKKSLKCHIKCRPGAVEAASLQSKKTKTKSSKKTQNLLKNKPKCIGYRTTNAPGQQNTKNLTTDNAPPSSSSGSPKKSKFFNELDEVLGGQPNIEPRITISSCGEVMTSEKTNSNKKKSLEDEENDEQDSHESNDDSDDERKADEDVDKAELTLKERKRRKSKKDKKRKREKEHNIILKITKNKLRKQYYIPQL